MLGSVLVGLADHLGVIRLQSFKVFTQFGDVPDIRIDLTIQEVGLLVGYPDELLLSVDLLVQGFHLIQYAPLLFSLGEQEPVDFPDFILELFFPGFEGFLLPGLGVGPHPPQGDDTNKDPFCSIDQPRFHFRATGLKPFGIL